MHKENWDDMRFALAVAEHGSVSGAARQLGVNHATVLRRVATLEERLGARLFDKTQQGYAVAPDRGQVIDAIREVDTAVHGVRRVVEGARAPLRGVVRVTSTDTFCHAILPEALVNLRGVAQDLRVDLICSNAHLDMARLAADITVRPTNKLADDLVGTVAAKLGFAVYESAGGADAWLALSGDIARAGPADWLAQIVPAGQIAGSGGSFLTLARMAAAGMGRAILPCLIGDKDRNLNRITTDMPHMSVDIWVACHMDLVEVPRIRAVRDFLTQSLSDQADQIFGQAT